MFTYYFSFILVYSLIHILTYFMHVHLSLLFYTLIGTLSDDPGFARLDWMFYFIDQVLMSSYASREVWSYTRLDHRYSFFLLFRWFFFLYVSVLVIILFHFYVHCYHV